MEKSQEKSQEKMEKSLEKMERSQERIEKQQEMLAAFLVVGVIVTINLRVFSGIGSHVLAPELPQLSK